MVCVFPPSVEDTLPDFPVLLSRHLHPVLRIRSRRQHGSQVHLRSCITPLYRQDVRLPRCVLGRIPHWLHSPRVPPSTNVRFSFFFFPRAKTTLTTQNILHLRLQDSPKLSLCKRSGRCRTSISSQKQSINGWRRVADTLERWGIGDRTRAGSGRQRHPKSCCRVNAGESRNRREKAAYHRKVPRSSVSFECVLM